MRKLIIGLLTLVPFFAAAQIAPVEKRVIQSESAAIRQHPVHVPVDNIKSKSTPNESSQMRTMSTHSTSSITSVSAIDYLTSSVSAQDVDAYLRDFNQVGNTNMFSDSNVISVVNYFRTNVINLLDSSMSSQVPLKFIRYFRAYNYHVFYQSSMNFADGYVDSLFQALPHLYNKPEYWSSNNAVGEFRWEAGLAMDIDEHRGKIYQYIKLHMNTSTTSFLAAGSSQSHGVDAAAFIIWRGLANGDMGFLSAISNDTTFINDFMQVVNNPHLKSNHDWVTLNYINFIYPLIKAFSQNPTLNFNLTAFENELTSFEKTLTFGTFFHMKLISQLYRGDEFLEGNWSDWKQTYFDWEFSDTKSYDDGEIVLYTNMTSSRRNGLYLAMKEAKANFFKLMGDTNPIQGDTNESIKVYIYRNHQHYLHLSELLTGVSPIGGGVYIENNSAFYTFDREDILLSIEHLVKHEYVHYLDGRYNIHGTFGEYPFYDWNTGRYAFWTEGLAEYIASAPRAGEFYMGRYAAATVWDDVIMNNPSRMTLYQSTHNPIINGSRTYAYSNAAWSFLYTHKHSDLLQMIAAVRENRTNDFFTILNSISSIPSYETEYQSYLNSISVTYGNTFDAVGQNGGPANPYEFNPPVPNYQHSHTNVVSINTIQNVIDSTNVIGNSYRIFKSYNDPSWVRVEIDTVITGLNKSEVMKTIVSKINQKILKFDTIKQAFTGFEFVNGWMDSITTNGTNVSLKMVYEFPQFGVYTPPVTSQDNVTNPEGVITSILNTDVELIAYPNPFVSTLTVKGIKPGDYITMYDMNGRTVYYQSINDFSTTHEMNLGNLSSGMYILLVKQGTVSKTFKMIKN